MNKRTSHRLLLAILIVLLFAVLAFIFKQQIGGINVPTSQKPTTGKTDITNQNPDGDPVIAKLTIPDGFAMNVFAKNVKDARVIVFDAKARMLVSETSEGRIAVLEDTNKDGVADTNRTLISSLAKPHGLALLCANSATPTACTLFVAQQSKLVSYDYDTETGTTTNPKKLLDIPATATDRHFTRTLQFLPDNLTLLISVGSSCNVCNETDAMRGRIMAYNITTGKVGEYARGLRNAVFMTLSPNGNVFATEMGRDGLGDGFPPDEINLLQASNDYGWPNCYGKNVHDGVFDTNTYIRDPCTEPFETPSLVDLPAHSAPLGLAFMPSTWATNPSGNLLVAYHGSWNSSVPTGYKIARVSFDTDGNYVGITDFISGWLTSDGTKLGRPVDLVFGSDNALYISDDDTGTIYRLAKVLN